MNDTPASMGPISDLERAQTALEQRLARDEAILRSIGDGLIVTDKQNNVILMNKVASKMLGWEADLALGLPMSLVAPIENNLEGQKAGSPSATYLEIKSENNSTIYYLLRKDKTRFPAAITTASVVLDQDIIGAVIVFRDITEQIAADQAKRDFVAIASHQLRTPLGSMKWNLEMLLNGDFGGLSDEAKETLQLIFESNLRMVALVNDLLDVSRIDQGHVYDQPESTDIVPIISDAIAESKVAADRKGVQIELSVSASGLPPIVLDKKRFREVIQNLLSNAIKYNRVGGHTTVKAGQSGNKVLITVSDTGIGIAKKDQERMFSKFFRADNAIITETEGTGLGLYVVKSYVESWKGKIWFESEEGKGTTFYIEIPVTQ